MTDWIVNWTEAGQILVNAGLEADVAGPATTPQAYAAALERAGRLEDALGFTIHALPALPAVRFSARCALDCTLHQDGQLALAAALEWLDSPSEPRRRAAMAAAQAAGLADPGSFCALAVFWSGGGSIAPEEAVAVLPAEDLCNRAALAASALARSSAAPETYQAAVRRHLDWAYASARGQALEIQ